MDHLGPFAGVEARNTRFGDLSSHLHTHNLCQEKEDHFTRFTGKIGNVLETIFLTQTRRSILGSDCPNLNESLEIPDREAEKFVLDRQTDKHRVSLLELLSEPKTLETCCFLK